MNPRAGILSRSYRLSYLALLFSTATFVSGSFFGFPYKYLLTLVTALTLLALFAWTRTTFRPSSLLLLGTVAVALAYATAMGFVNGFGGHTARELVGLTSPLLIVLFYRKELLSPRLALMTILCGAAAYSLTKLAIAAAIFSGALSYFALNDFIVSAFGYSIMSFPIFGSLIRIYAVNDLIVSFMPVLLLGSYRLPLHLLWRQLFFGLFAASTFLSYSRFTMALFLLVTIVALLPPLRVRLRTLHVAALGTVLTAAVALVALNPAPLLSLAAPVIDRFDPSVRFNVGSDDLRSEQFDHIVDQIAARPVVGWGLGAYIEGYLRHDEDKYVYEMQLLSLAFKFGLPMLFLLFLVLAFLIQAVIRPSWRVHGLVLLLFSSAMFNPYIASSVFGVGLLILLLSFRRRDEPRRELNATSAFTSLSRSRTRRSHRTREARL